MNGNIINNDSDYEYMEEFICIQCSTSLQQSKPKMPVQACANDLNLDPIPQDLTELSTIERRLISYRLPFLTLIAMGRYRGHYKINGLPVNVPAKLDKIVEMLPRMPNELQLIPLKLKRKLEYKSYYMFDVIQKDSIIGALAWLKTHNNFYKDIPINYNWYSTVPDDDIPEMLICQQDVHDREENQFNNQQLQNNVLSKNYHICDTCENQVVDDVIQHMSHDNSTTVNHHCDMTTDQWELAEDQIALECRENLTGNVFPTVLQFENIENAIFQCAPAQNNIPKYVLLDDQFEVLAFTDLFPYGHFSYNSQKRSVKLPLRKYFQQRLLNVDGRFAKNIEYIFCAQHMIDLQHIQSEINLAIRLARGRTLHGNKITAGTL